MLGRPTKRGVLVLTGYDASVSVKDQQLLIRQRWAGQLDEQRWPKHTCPIERLIMPQPEGYVTMAAMRWLASIGASIVCLDMTGSPIMTSFLTGKSLPRTRSGGMSASLRRKQALLTGDRGLGLDIARALIAAKLSRQGAAGHAARIATAESAVAITQIEGAAASLYWGACFATPIRYDRRGPPVPPHWNTFGARQSSLSGSARHAATPANAVLNYLYGILASEITIALHAAGLDPMLGILHADKDGRASLTYDLMEPIRPVIDDWLFRWLADATFAKADFFENERGNITLARRLASYIGETALHWKPFAAAVAGWFLACLKGDCALPLILPGAPMPALMRGCSECGRVLTYRQKLFCSGKCAASFHGVAAPGLVNAHSTAAQSKRRSAGLRDAAARAAFPPFPAEQQAAASAWYSETVQGRLADIPAATIARATGVTHLTASKWKRGISVPHPRHFAALAELAGVPMFERYIRG